MYVPLVNPQCACAVELVSVLARPVRWPSISSAFSLNLSRKLNVLVHLHGNVLGCCQSAALTAAETAQGFKDARHLHICHSSYGLTINSRLLADHTAHHFSVKLSLFMCILAACSGSPPQCSTFSSDIHSATRLISNSMV